MTNRYCPLCKKEMHMTFGKTYKDLVCQRDDHFFSERIDLYGLVSTIKIRITDVDGNYYVKNNYIEDSCEVWRTKNIFDYGERVSVEGIIRFRSYEPKKVLEKIKTLLMVS